MVALGFDARPLDGKAIAIQAERSEQADVLLEAVVVVAGVERRLFKKGRAAMLQDPQVAVYVVTFYLVRSRSGAPNKIRRKRCHQAGLLSSLEHSAGHSASARTGH